MLTFYIFLQVVLYIKKLPGFLRYAYSLLELLVRLIAPMILNLIYVLRTIRFCRKICKCKHPTVSYLWSSSIIDWHGSLRRNCLPFSRRVGSMTALLLQLLYDLPFSRWVLSISLQLLHLFLLYVRRLQSWRSVRSVLSITLQLSLLRPLNLVRRVLSLTLQRTHFLPLSLAWGSAIWRLLLRPLRFVRFVACFYPLNNIDRNVWLFNRQLHNYRLVASETHV